ncbi:hypothetical protein DFP78_115107 [Photobacterium lutimaris]|nr:hypothetical protein DFP78_115107 [Photobacterium lutimaris]
MPVSAINTAVYCNGIKAITASLLLLLSLGLIQG